MPRGAPIGYHSLSCLTSDEIGMVFHNKSLWPVKPFLEQLFEIFDEPLCCFAQFITFWSNDPDQQKWLTSVDFQILNVVVFIRLVHKIDAKAAQVGLRQRIDGHVVAVRVNGMHADM